MTSLFNRSSDSSSDGLTRLFNGSISSCDVSFNCLSLFRLDGLLEGFSDLNRLWREVTTVDCREVSSCFTLEVMLGSVKVLERFVFDRGLYPWKGCTWPTNEPLLRGRILLGMVFTLFFLLLAVGIDVDLVWEGPKTTVFLSSLDTIFQPFVPVLRTLSVLRQGTVGALTLVSIGWLCERSLFLSGGPGSVSTAAGNSSSAQGEI